MLKKLLLLSLIGISSLLFAAGKEPGKDHAMVSRYTGSVMKGYWHSKYDEGFIPLGKIKKHGEISKKQDFEGEITVIHYKNPKGRSTLEIMRNYEKALKSQKFETLWECKNKECGNGSISPAEALMGSRKKLFFINNNQPRTLSAKLTKNGKDDFVYVYIQGDETYLYVFESATLETGMVSSGESVQKAKEPGIDHPIAGRYAGAVMKQYWHNQYDEGFIPLGEIKKRKGLEKKLDFEGEITAIHYTHPKERSTLEIMRNYEQLLHSQGFETIWQCKHSECGDGSITPAESLTGANTQLYFINDNLPRTLSVKRTQNGQDAYVYVYIQGEQTCLYFFEPEAMETDMVSADSMAKDIAESGKAVLHINFDTGKDVILEDSLPVIDQIAELMNNYPTMRINIQGHTDSQGSDTDNQSLSEKRAAAVQKALSDKGIDIARLESEGLGESQPVADNSTEEGRAQNRRVEIVNLTPDAIK